MSPPLKTEAVALTGTSSNQQKRKLELEPRQKDIGFRKRKLELDRMELDLKRRELEFDQDEHVLKKMKVELDIVEENDEVPLASLKDVQSPEPEESPNKIKVRLPKPLQSEIAMNEFSPPKSLQSETAPKEQNTMTSKSQELMRALAHFSPGAKYRPSDASDEYFKKLRVLITVNVGAIRQGFEDQTWEHGPGQLKILQNERAGTHQLVVWVQSHKWIAYNSVLFDFMRFRTRIVRRGVILVELFREASLLKEVWAFEVQGQDTARELVNMMEASRKKFYKI